MHQYYQKKATFTGKSFSEALILASVNPQYDKRLFIEFPEKYKFRTFCVKFIYSEKATKICKIFTLLLTGTT